MNRMVHRLLHTGVWIAILIFCGFVFGCASASLRVEVEVYKGPLSTNKLAQIGELTGIIREGKKKLKAFRDGASLYRYQINCQTPSRLIDDRFRKMDAELQKVYAEVSKTGKKFKVINKIVDEKERESTSDKEKERMLKRFPIIQKNLELILKMIKVLESDIRTVFIERAKIDPLDVLLRELEEYINQTHSYIGGAMGTSDPVTSLEKALSGLFYIKAVIAGLNYRMAMHIGSIDGRCYVLDQIIDGLDKLFVRIEEGQLAAEETLEKSLVKKESEIFDLDKKEVRELIVGLKAIATQVEGMAFVWAEYQIGSIPKDKKFRRFLTDFTTLTSEFSNQVSSRTDVLIKQIHGVEGRNLATSDHLRDASPTQFLQLYDWYEAANSGVKGSGSLSPAERVKVAQRLFADHYWTNINEVYASGTGKVGTALVKDDIGNWNLKSFDNDPSELLDAYRKFTLAGIQTAVKIAQEATAPGASTLPALDKATSSFALNRVGADRTTTANENQIRSMRERAVTELKALRDTKKSRMEELAAEALGAQKTFDGAKLEADRLRREHQTEKQKLSNKKEKLLEQTQIQGDLKKKQDSLIKDIDRVNAEIDNLPADADSEQRDSLMKQLGVWENEKTEVDGDLRSSNEKLESLQSEVKDLKASEKTARDKKIEQEKIEQQEAAKFKTARQDLIQYAESTMQEAEIILTVHRRTIDVLKAAQVAASDSGGKSVEIHQDVKGAAGNMSGNIPK